MINLFLITFCLNLFLTNFLINIFRERNVRQYVLKDAPQTHLAKQGTPTMGGLAIIISIIFVLIFQRTYVNFNIYMILFLLISFGLIGMIDDLEKVFKRQNKGLKARHKFLLQIIVASIFVGILAAANHYGSVSGLLSHVPAFVYYIFIVLLIVGFSNAVNLTDGLDGLAAGNLLIAFIGIFLFTFFNSNYNLMMLSLVIMGTIFAFLWFNVNPAKIFMGDIGSLSLGAVLAGISILIHKELLLLILGIVFVIETLSVMLQVSYFKLTKGKRIFKMSPLHHHFELSGWTENKVVTRFWIIGVLALLIAMNFS
ncbi:MAG: phospho-N-acetylmuramoyl-pentapeptide-transferase [Candidatus Margulisbacteria bacterium]|nr:phospho-N-acetylmuramoyl-pentapeptide-transferase [Candidatus Margulisiibacteriota bacterium]